jgi:hypothetical protein
MHFFFILLLFCLWSPNTVFQHPVLKCPMFFPQSERPSFTHTTQQGELYFDLYCLDTWDSEVNGIKHSLWITCS